MGHESSSEHAQYAIAVTLLTGIPTALTEVLVGQPGDNCSKRIQNHPLARLPTQRLWQYYGPILLQEALGKGAKHWLASLYRGGLAALEYKIPQSLIRVSGFLYLQPWMQIHLSPHLPDTWGDTQKSTAIGAILGLSLGLMELGLLPLEARKVGLQTGTMHEGRWALLCKEGFGLYRAATPAALRNTSASGAFFATDSLVKAHLQHLPEDLRNALAAACATLACLFACNPAEVIKTRVQAARGQYTPLQALKLLLSNQGPAALFSGLFPKILTALPKTTAAFTLAQWLAPHVKALVSAPPVSPQSPGRWGLFGGSAARPAPSRLIEDKPCEENPSHTPTPPTV